jgi:hypothetical protein
LSRYTLSIACELQCNWSWRKKYLPEFDVANRQRFAGSALR